MAGWTVLSLAVYMLTGIRRDHAAGTEAAFKYFLPGASASAFVATAAIFHLGTLPTAFINQAAASIATIFRRDLVDTPRPSRGRRNPQI